MRVSLRAKMVLVALVLALIPFVGYLHVKRIRRKFQAADERFAAIDSVYGLGYRWNS
jgi:uncharacterized protein involved in tellurium resistance